MGCPLWVGSEVLLQVEEYLGVLFKERMEQEVDRQIGAASRAVQTQDNLIVVKKELSQKVRLSVLIDVPFLLIVSTMIEQNLLKSDIFAF